MIAPGGDCTSVEYAGDDPEAPDCVAENVTVGYNICKTEEEVTIEESALPTSVSEGKIDEASSLPVVKLEEKFVPSEAEDSRVTLVKLVVVASDDVDTDAPVSTNVGDSTSVDEVRTRLTDTVVMASTNEEVNMLVSLENRGSCAVIGLLKAVAAGKRLEDSLVVGSEEDDEVSELKVEVERPNSWLNASSCSVLLLLVGTKAGEEGAIPEGWPIVQLKT